MIFKKVSSENFLKIIEPQIFYNKMFLLDVTIIEKILYFHK